MTPTDLARFIAKCRFDPGTGCVIWTGGQTSGRGHSSPYGAFWFAGRRWFAHRWAAQFIHGLDIDGAQVDHCCPPGRTGYGFAPPNTLCVHHVRPLSPAANRQKQTLDQRRYWIYCQVGLEEPPPIWANNFTEIPFYPEPEWMKQ
ncbi:MAG: hypothetical protein KGO96_12385 [Elusimicrobia bacterium]|nr:hypothetical protein [Elusimicrobiota bacterium]